MVVAGLALADFRVQRIDGGFALRFGDAPASTLPVRAGTLADATDMGIANPGATQSLDDGVETEWVVNQMHEYNLVIVGDAHMAPSELLEAICIVLGITSGEMENPLVTLHTLR